MTTSAETTMQAPRAALGASEQRPADVFVVFGITGDLAKVMTFHSLYRLEKRGLLDCPIVGVAVDDTAYVHYTLWLPNGQQVDTNVGGPVFPFIVGRGMVILGFDEGVRGMKKGGQRQLIIPPNLGYGRSPRPGIPGNSILVFNILVDSIK